MLRASAPNRLWSFSDSIENWLVHIFWQWVEVIKKIPATAWISLPDTGQACHMSAWLPTPQHYLVCSPVIPAFRGLTWTWHCQSSWSWSCPCRALDPGIPESRAVAQTEPFSCFFTLRLAALALADGWRAQLASFLLLLVPMFPSWPSYLQKTATDRLVFFFFFNKAGGKLTGLVTALTSSQSHDPTRKGVRSVMQ